MTDSISSCAILQTTTRKIAIIRQIVVEALFFENILIPSSDILEAASKCENSVVIKMFKH
jgi:hypothetical protein